MNNFEQELFKMARLTGWRQLGWEHISIFDETGLDKASDLVRKIMETIRENKQADKFILFDPIEELF